jgi:hypothetical protein
VEHSRLHEGPKLKGVSKHCMACFARNGASMQKVGAVLSNNSSACQAHHGLKGCQSHRPSMS